MLFQVNVLYDSIAYGKEGTKINVLIRVSQHNIYHYKS